MTQLPLLFLWQRIYWVITFVSSPVPLLVMKVRVVHWVSNWLMNYVRTRAMVWFLASWSCVGGTVLHEIELQEPIRYALNDPIEKWLYKLLCLDCTSVQYRLRNGCPHPDQCQLYYIDRDSLFSYHKLSEAFLQRIMSLYVSSHYKVCLFFLW